MFIIVVLLVFSVISVYASQYWLARWAEADSDRQDDTFWIWVLLALTGAGIGFLCVAVFMFYTALLDGSSRLHSEMLQRVLRAPLRFFHVNPTGRIINRFSKDMGYQDEELPLVGFECIEVSIQASNTRN